MFLRYAQDCVLAKGSVGASLDLVAATFSQHLGLLFVSWFK